MGVPASNSTGISVSMQSLTILLMSGVWIQVLQFIAALSLLIVLHEGGHFFFARLFKTRVEKFYLFFDFLFPFAGLLNFSLWKKKIGDTVYGLGWFPLGGYVKIAGMVDESMDKEQMEKPPEPWEYRSKPAWQRLFIMLGGIIVNVLLGVIIYSMILFAYGKDRIPTAAVTNGIAVTDSFGYKLGFLDGDRILAVNGKPMKYYDDVQREIIFARTITVERGGSNVDLNIPIDFVGQLSVMKQVKRFIGLRVPTFVDSLIPGGYAMQAGLQKNDQIVGVNGMETPFFDQLYTQLFANRNAEVTLNVMRGGNLLVIPARVDSAGRLGYTRVEDIDKYQKLGILKVEHQSYGFFESIPAGLKYSWGEITFYARQFKLIFNPKTGAYKGVGGFGSMSKMFTAYWDWQEFWTRVAFLSIILAFMNLLPIPGLDGGYVLFLILEMISGRKVPDRVMEIANTVGLVMLLALMLYANGNDIFKAFRS